MVKSQSCVQVLIGRDFLAKEEAINRFKRQLLEVKSESFNLDILYAKELTLEHLQERLLSLPVASCARVIVIKCAGELKEEIKEYLSRYIKNPYAHAALVLDFDYVKFKDSFVKQLVASCPVRRFGEEIPVNTFGLSRQIEMKKPAQALHMLHQLLDQGEKPERILGALRVVAQQRAGYPAKTARRFKLLLMCDLDIKTGRVKPLFALERLIVRLSYL